MVKADDNMRAAYCRFQDRHTGLLSDPIELSNLRTFILESLDSYAAGIAVLVPPITPDVFACLLGELAKLRIDDIGHVLDDDSRSDLDTRLASRIERWRADGEARWAEVDSPVDLRRPSIGTFPDLEKWRDLRIEFTVDTSAIRIFIAGLDCGVYGYRDFGTLFDDGRQRHSVKNLLWDLLLRLAENGEEGVPIPPGNKSKAFRSRVQRLKRALGEIFRMDGSKAITCAWRNVARAEFQAIGPKAPRSGFLAERKSSKPRYWKKVRAKESERLESSRSGSFCWSRYTEHSNGLREYHFYRTTSRKNETQTSVTDNFTVVVSLPATHRHGIRKNSLVGLCRLILAAGRVGAGGRYDVTDDDLRDFVSRKDAGKRGG